ncbi:hypothetical protein A2765_02290 [Candidatus Kaiserbacteria bacterium RIFCSPHIGHO2_01_FULL_56_24]|uniref:Uncharacterized protein n=1 Tax=Candidatus Kaiserbacteria bacterium RIFCSPHIGHO2_01_FULL_56_24 TaxID=1798487 RepID=A0A1F6DAU9_9BACT|nr:MAG: hypothetical protein A2765_02290 [Candidatus Kaiserbacteria bacterium RIFCSPHIGHO2_01_FULL_56_24]
MNSRFFANRIFTTIIVLLVISSCFMTPLVSASFVHAQGIPGTGGGAAGATAGVLASAGITEPKTSCVDWWDWFINFSTCGGRSLAVWIGTGLIYITSWFLGVAGVLFNWVIDFTISPQMYSSIQGGVNGVWTAFRDVSNIIIIGMFTFIAISMILGVESFGSRKMVARVLIIAVLINFSLLFTRIIIESSNFVARQFYKAVQLQTGVPVSPAVAGANASSDAQFIAGISGRFAQLMGVAGIWDTREALMKTAENRDNGWIALLQGLLTAMVFLAAAGIFLYAAFLLIARALLFIFLLITSAPAFAAYLVPKMGDQYWSMWWGSLLRNGIFAPLLMLLLWATVSVGEGLVAATGSTGSLGSLLAEPANGGNVNALFNYLIILGMLFISVKFASSFSTKIAGLDWATTIGAGIPLGLSARLAGLAGRNFVGRGFAKRSERLGDEAGDIKGLIARVPKGAAFDRRRSFLEGRLAGLEGSKKFADKMAGSKFTLGGTDIGKQILKAAGAPGALAGDGKGVTSFGEFQKKTAEEAAKRAAEITKLSSGDETKIRAGATAVLEKQKEVLQKNIEVADRNAKAEETTRASDIRKHEDEIRIAEANRATWQRTRPAGPGRDADLDREKMRIDNARKEIDKLREQFKKNAGLDTLTKTMEDLKEKIDKVGKEAVVEGRKNVKAAGETLAQNIAYGRNTNVLSWASGGNPKNDLITRTARKEYNKKVGDAGEENRILDALKRRMGPGAPTPPHTP